MIVDEKYLLDKQKEEIEFLAEDRDRYKELFHQAVKNRDEFVALADTKQKQCETMSKNYGILYNEKVELQKKVDELAYELAKKSIATEGINVTNTNISLCVHEKLLEQAVKDTAPLAIQRFINQLYIDRIITDSDLENEMLKVKFFVLKRYYGVEVD